MQDKHLSTQFDNELNQVSAHVLELGGMVEMQIRQAMYYFGIILFFAVGAGIGGNLSMRLGFKAIWFSSAVLAVSILLMFIEEKEKSLC